MKLYIYEHCPFSARVRYVAGMLNIPLDVLILDYDDDQTTNQIIGSKQVPLLIKESGEALAESLDIIQFLLESVNSSETAQPAQTTLDWQRSAFLPLQKIGYPRWFKLGLPEFKTASAQQAWRVKKETTELHFESLLKDTPQIALQVQASIDAVKQLLKLHSYQHVALIDEAIIFSILRGFFSAPEIQWDSEVRDWMVSVSQKTQVRLLQEPLQITSQK
ncbi:glutaredoxin 2 [Vibrio cholerae]|uniref:glutaredoxin 2 n=1 Tax=Vibrio cholerae TaxID=666 RepID=UPI0011D55C75|nr:glutaredoxin 2 [Vibrio cholerae]EGR0363827.1 glutaredoxin 2 [Vibrio cholerae]EGR0936998.1 glutaredoxin 2 [Vibrio cholerae]EIA0767921.1 glutaredoxin 2 [Vibrio cholerae]EID0158010.1 glutaredoxin 2 [Vibrio cholerae]EJL6347443.1 glutaredoxin 2 [Vibrio cholerae]